jgi:hypothetical protein
MLKWNDFVSEIRETLGAEASMSGTIKGWRTKKGSFFCRECGTLMFFPNSESQYLAITELASRLGVLIKCDDLTYIEFEVTK